MSWLSGYRRLSLRYERDSRNYLVFLGLAAALCCSVKSGWVRPIRWRCRTSAAGWPAAA
jgi:hypothetical protein